MREQPSKKLGAGCLSAFAAACGAVTLITTLNFAVRDAVPDDPDDAALMGGLVGIVGAGFGWYLGSIVAGRIGLAGRGAIHIVSHSRERRAGLRCGRCDNKFEEGIPRYDYDGTLVCEACARFLGDIEARELQKVERDA